MTAMREALRRFFGSPWVWLGGVLVVALRIVVTMIPNEPLHFASTFLVVLFIRGCWLFSSLDAALGSHKNREKIVRFMRTPYAPAAGLLLMMISMLVPPTPNPVMFVLNLVIFAIMAAYHIVFFTVRFGDLITRFRIGKRM